MGSDSSLSAVPTASYSHSAQPTKPSSRSSRSKHCLNLPGPTRALHVALCAALLAAFFSFSSEAAQGLLQQDGSTLEKSAMPAEYVGQSAARTLSEAEGNQESGGVEAAQVWRLTYAQKGRHVRHLRQMDYARHPLLQRPTGRQLRGNGCPFPCARKPGGPDLGRSRGNAARRAPLPRSKLPPPPAQKSYELTGNVFPAGLYHLDLVLGQPLLGRAPYAYSLVVDTGSDLTWVQCNAPCVKCQQGSHPPFNPVKSTFVLCSTSLCKTAQRGVKQGCLDSARRCIYDYGYTSSTISTEGFLIQDRARVALANGSAISFPFVFGCGYSQNGNLIKKGGPDGVLGLGPTALSLPSQLGKRGVGSVFGHCLGGAAQGGGYLFMGDSLVPSKGVSWTPMVGQEQTPPVRHYFAQLTDLSINRHRINVSQDALDYYEDFEFGLSQGGFMFDSGTTYTYFVTEAFNPFIARLNNMMRKRPLERAPMSSEQPYFLDCWRQRTGRSFKSVQEASVHFPMIHLFFEGATMSWSPEGYIVIDGRGNACLGIFDAGPVEFGLINIIGEISMRNHLVMFDNVKKRIGWVKRDCSESL